MEKETCHVAKQVKEYFLFLFSILLLFLRNRHQL